MSKKDLKLTVEKNWLDQETAGCEFKDKRIGKRFKNVITQLWNGIGESVPYACQDWANTKAAYRFFSNRHVNEKQILQGHFHSTQERFSHTREPILILQDTTTFSYQRDKPELIGITHLLRNGNIFAKSATHTQCGIQMHSSLAVTTQDLPLGLAAIKFWTRKKFKGTNALKKHVNPTRISIKKKESYRWLQSMEESTKLFNEPNRCIHIGDRESDIYELFCTAKEIGTNFLVRTCVNRLTGDGKHTISDEMDEVKVKGLHRLEVQDKKGNLSKAILEIRYRRIKVLPPIGKQKEYPGLWLTVIHAEEKGYPKHREKIAWKLMTNLSITSSKEAIEKLYWYSLRWKIETFHKILKSGCKAESSKLRTANRLVNLLAIFCILSWRIFWMTMINRCHPTASVETAFTDKEIKVITYLTKSKAGTSPQLSDFINKIARLGGYLARKSDPPPGNIVMWRGLSRLTDILLGIDLGREIVGN